MSKERIQILELIDNICEQFEALLIQKRECDIADWIKLVGKPHQEELFLELLRLEAFHNPDDCSNTRIGDYFRRFPDFSNQIAQVFAESHDDLDGVSVDPQTICQVAAGDMIDRFKIISPLGAGGFSAVYLAHDPDLNQAVALKVIRPQSGGNLSRNSECIINEANVLSRINHPSIPKVHDAGKDANGMPWVSMEFIKGDSLYHLLATDQLSLVEILRILVKTANAVHVVHEAGFAHRDIKPDNIIIGLDGEPRILDYGLALHEDIQRDKSGERAGTTAFMSPEQVQGLSEDLDGRTDIWSLGVLLYLVIAKRLPFHGETKQDIRRDIVLQPVKPPRQIKSNVATIELENICFRALKKNPEDRYSTSRDFAEALQSAIDVLPAEFVLQEASRTRELTKSERYTIELARKARIWNAQPGVESLPGLFRYLSLRMRTNKSLWSPTESALMAATSKHLIRVGLLLAAFVAVFSIAQYQVYRSEQEARIREMLAAINQAPISEVVATFERQSAFAPAKCLNAIRDGFKETSLIDSAKMENLRYAIILGRGHLRYQELFKESLIDAHANDIKTLRELAFPRIEENSVPKLNEQWRQRLTETITTSAFVPGIENIWEKAPDKYGALFRAAGGKLTARYACCPRMELSKFKTLSDELRQYRYQPYSVRPFVTKDKVFVSAIWHRSSADWEISYGLKPHEFMDEFASRETIKHLVDVHNGLESPGKSPLLIAIWSNREQPYGKARHMLLASRFPELADPQWSQQTDQNYCVIPKDIQTDYLAATPLLIDIDIHGDTFFKPLESREQQKIHLGNMISNSCKLDFKAIPGTEEYQRLEAGSKLVAEAHYALGNFDKSASNFQRKLDAGTWNELIKRTLSLARSGDHESAIHSNALLNKKLDEAVSSMTRPFLTFGEAIAISTAVQTEIEFWEDRDIRKFINLVTSRIRRAEARYHGENFTLWAEYYANAMATNSVCQIFETASDEQSKKHAKKLKGLTNKFVRESIKLKPILKRNYLKWHESQSSLDSGLLGSYLYNEEQPVKSSVWTAFAANCDSRFIRPSTQLSNTISHNRLDDSYYPISYIHGNRVDDVPRIGSIWHSDLRTVDFVHQEQRLANAFCFGLLHGEDLGVWKILGSSTSSNLKKRIIETIFKFDVSLPLLLDRLDSSENSHERLAILSAIRPYSNSTNSIDSTEMKILLASLDQVDAVGSEKEQALCKIIRINVSPPQKTTTAVIDRDRF